MHASSPPGEVGERRPSALLEGRVLSHSANMAQKVVEDHLAVHTLIRAYQVLPPYCPAVTQTHTHISYQFVMWIDVIHKLKD